MATAVVAAEKPQAGLQLDVLVEQLETRLAAGWSEQLETRLAAGWSELKITIRLDDVIVFRVSPRRRLAEV